METTILKHVVVENHQHLEHLIYSTFLNNKFQYNIKVNRSVINNDFQIGYVVLETQVMFNYKSPDGFPISHEDFHTEKKANEFFRQWVKKFEIQGYYSSIQYGKIPLNILGDFCELYKIYL